MHKIIKTIYITLCIFIFTPIHAASMLSRLQKSTKAHPYRIGIGFATVAYGGYLYTLNKNYKKNAARLTEYNEQIDSERQDALHGAIFNSTFEAPGIAALINQYLETNEREQKEDRENAERALNRAQKLTLTRFAEESLTNPAHISSASNIFFGISIVSAALVPLVLFPGCWIHEKFFKKNRSRSWLSHKLDELVPHNYWPIRLSRIFFGHAYDIIDPFNGYRLIKNATHDSLDIYKKNIVCIAIPSAIIGSALLTRAWLKKRDQIVKEALNQRTL